MTLPIGFLLGLLVVVGHRELGTALPGEGTVDGLLLASFALLVPVLLVQVAYVVTLRALVLGRPVKVPPRSLLMLSRFATPLALHVLFAYGAYGDWIDRLAPTSHFLRTLLAVAPLYAIELPRLLFVGRVDALLEADLYQRGRVLPPSLLPQWRDVWPAIRLRYGWPLLALLPTLLLGAGLDALQLDRTAYVMVFTTSVGITVATILFLLVVATLLPFAFRLAFGVRRELPEPAGESLRATARAIGFPPQRVMLLPTGLRAVNAMMVGPLPVGRLLCMTDGLLEVLDLRSLSGVLAHEAGHARMGHPGILMLLAVVMPLLLVAPANLLDLEQLDAVVQAFLLITVVLLGWSIVRALARRFEHEADIASVQMLGAEPCSSALHRVAGLASASVHLPRRLLSLHPDERHRLDVMHRYERDPAFRERFDVRSRTVRRWIHVAVGVAFAAAIWAWATDWRHERLLVRFHTGDFVGARAALAETAGEAVPNRWRELREQLQVQVACALEVAPECRDWSTAETALQPAAWQRGERVLIAQGPAAAYPWFALATMVMDEPSTVELAIWRYCRAADEGDAEAVAELVEIIRRLGPPTSLAEVFE